MTQEQKTQIGKAIREAREWMAPLPGESALDQSERFAAKFCASTGMLAPGKDQAAAVCDATSYEERRDRWTAWCQESKAKIIKQLDDALTALADERR